MAEFALAQHAEKNTILDVEGKCGICDYFVICSGETGVQTRAIAHEVVTRCKEQGYAVHHYEEDSEARWILVDLFDIIVHIFTREARLFYNLEYLWADARKVRVLKNKKISLPSRK
ncbi:MAG: ribosome silencing factor [Candidatus Omnitrophota bacterium]